LVVEHLIAHETSVEEVNFWQPSPDSAFKALSPDFFGIFSPLSNKQKKLSAAMISYWTQFAKTGDPNSPGRATWHPYSASNDEFQSLIPPVPMAEHNFDSAHHCSTFWDTF